ncbi:ATP-binding protein [Pseudophaeobacter sp.]|uniref:ATP-binding protein n=1 Tax=Pseudophaeobacter sp. TaxID=1971739 RepID=UPI003296F2BB
MISLSMNFVTVGPMNMVLNALSGVLLFAGYLGGPLGALVVGGCAVGYRIAIGDPLPALGIFLVVSISSVGLGGSYLKAAPNWPEIPQRVLGTMLLVYSLLFLVPLWLLPRDPATELSMADTAMVVAIFYGTGVLSILATWKIMQFAIRYAEKANSAAELAESLDLAMRVSGMGRFKRARGDRRPFFDSGMVAIYGLEDSVLPSTGESQGLVPISDWEELVHPEDFPAISAEASQVWEGEKLVGQGEFRARRPDGSIRFIRAVWISDSKNGSLPTRVMGVHTDLTDALTVEKQNQASLQRLAMLVEKLPGVIMEFDATDTQKPELLYVSPKCKEILGVTEDKFYQNPLLFSKLHDPDDLDEFMSLLIHSCETGGSFYHRYRVNARGGAVLWLDYYGASTIESDGRVVHRAVVLDATPEVEVQTQVQQEREIARRAQKFESIGQLTGGVAHDFNNLLAVVLGNLELLREDEALKNQHRLVDAAIKATLRGADLTRNMLSFARKAPLTPVQLDLNAVVREAGSWMGRTLPESVTVATALAEGLWLIDADRSSLESALLNLTLNARDAMEGQGSLTIETANVHIDEEYLTAHKEDLPPGRYVMLAVSDTGPGIPKEILASIFEPFYTTKPPGVGSGLGLSMTQGFVQQSGGTVQVYSEVGEGTSFKLYFPATSAPSDHPEKPTRSTPLTGGAGLKLLLAEDEEEVRSTLENILERAGYQVTAAPSGDDAFAAFAEDPSFDLLLTDIVMPGTLQGTSLAKALRARWPDLPVVFMSGYASEATVHGNGLRPEDIRLMKPVQRGDLLAALEKAASYIKS